MSHHAASPPSSTDGEPHWTDRRYPCRKVILLAVAGSVGRTASVAFVRDISLRGMGLLLRRQVELGSLLILERPARGKSVTLIAKVVHRQHTAEGWLTGCELYGALTSEELHSWRA